MTNLQIILGAMELAGVSFDTTVNTYAGWRRKGYTVKKGQKAVFKTKIWKPCVSKKDVPEIETDIDGETTKNLRLVNASFFTEDQVEKLEV